MNWAHWRTIVWLRWRLACNQIKKLGIVSQILLWLVIGCSAVAGVMALLLSIAMGGSILPETWPAWMVLVWDGLIIVFLSFWVTGVLSDLQRSEPLALDKFLHLPISPASVFLLNYFNSIVSLSIVTFAPALAGLCWAMVVRYGWSMAFGFLLLLAYLLMITALTFQFRGWIGLLMQNKRRRRQMLTLITVTIVLLSQIPNLLNSTVFENRDRESSGTRVAAATERENLDRLVARGELTAAEADARFEAFKMIQDKKRQAGFERIVATARTANTFVPFLWLPAGIDALANGHWLVASAFLLGMSLITSVSLWRSYLSTLKLYRGGADLRRPSPQLVAAPDRAVEGGAASSAERGDGGSVWMPNWIEWRPPLLNEQQSGVALMTLRSMARAPEAKLAIFAPLLGVAVLASLMIFRAKTQVGVVVRPLTGLGFCFFTMVGVSQLLQNQFGFDRDGFRALLLSPIRERDVLIGKNAATAPIAIALALLVLIAQQIGLPMRASHFLATLVQLGTMYVVASLVGNFMSILTPMALASGSLKPANYKFGTMLVQFLLFFLAPLAMIPALLPLGIELLTTEVFHWPGWPIYLLGAIVYFAMLLGAYFWLVGLQADLFRKRKWKILEAITAVSS